jgi:DNA (cytosine-5)-methyltransferase 1
MSSGAVVITAAHFVPQSRPRVFFIAVRKGEAVPRHLIAEGPQQIWHPSALLKAYAGMTREAPQKWVWWNLPTPAARNTRFADLIEENPNGVEWHTASETKYLLGLMSQLHREKVTEAQKSGRRMVGTVYRRTRPDTDGVKRQRAEVRFDDIAGCLRTPAGGSSRQTILVVEGKRVRSRLLSRREAARLMGMPDDYRLPPGYNEAYHICGDGVCVPVVRYIAKHVLEPLLAAPRLEVLAAAE